MYKCVACEQPFIDGRALGIHQSKNRVCKAALRNLASSAPATPFKAELTAAAATSHDQEEPTDHWQAGQEPDQALVAELPSLLDEADEQVLETDEEMLQQQPRSHTDNRDTVPDLLGAELDVPALRDRASVRSASDLRSFDTASPSQNTSREVAVVASVLLKCPQSLRRDLLQYYPSERLPFSNIKEFDDFLLGDQVRPLEQALACGAILMHLLLQLPVCTHSDTACRDGPCTQSTPSRIQGLAASSPSKPLQGLQMCCTDCMLM